MLYYNSVSNIMRIYSGSAWENVAVSTAGFATLAGVETLTNKTLTAPKINEDVAVTSTATELNLLDGVSGLVQADLTKLAAIDSTAAELNTLDALSRGSIIYGNASAATAILTKGTVGQVLTSDGTDIAWGDAASGLEWQSSIVTVATLTAVANKGYWIDTTSNACTITLPGSASVGDELVFVDYARNWGTNAITIDQNSLNFQGYTSPNPVYDTDGQSVTIVYSGATKGWIPTVDDDVTDEVIQPYSVEYLVVAGGGGGGNDVGGGGGAGGLLSNTLSIVETNTYTITIGAGGTGLVGPRGANGGNSEISGTGITTVTAIGGGGGGSWLGNTGATGGSGGGGGASGGNGGSGTVGQGNAGGNGITGGFAGGNGIGGGGGGAGASGSSQNAGNGSSAYSAWGSATSTGQNSGGTYYYAGGGGGSDDSGGTTGTAGLGGGGTAGNNGTANTGGGACGGGSVLPNGGSGIIILRYSGSQKGTGGTVVSSGGYTYHTFTSTGTYTG
jgi:hypothetical protein